VDTDDPIAPPAQLVDSGQMDELVDRIGTALVQDVGADPGRDADRMRRAVDQAVDVMARKLDLTESLTDVPPLVFAALVNLSALYLKRASFAFGAAGYDPIDVDALRAEGAILASVETYRERWGIA
jgi:hypothetical protein